MGYVTVEDSLQEVYVEVWVVVAGEADESVDPTCVEDEDEEVEEDNKVPDGVVVYLVEILNVDG